jgi:hypothetical protein
MSLLDKLKSNSPDNKLSLEGNGFNPQRASTAFGYENPNVNSPQNPLDPSLSALQNTYSVNSIPAKVRIVDFNKTQYKSFLPPESQLDELDINAPKNLRAGKLGSVVSQIYKSATGRKYRDLGPTEGRY